jgi:hypothetical protein
MIRPSLPDRRSGVALEKISRKKEEDSKELTPEKRRKGLRLPSWKHSLQVASLALYLVTWVANGVLLQGITSGFGDKRISYNKPAAVTWFSYNFMMLSGLIFWRHTQSSQESVYHFVRNTWAGDLGLKRATQRCIVIAYMLMLLNVFLVLGLECISISLSNAVYQLQTPLTLTLSVCCLQTRGKWVRAESIGLLVSLAGILFIVLPPLMSDGSGGSGGQSDKSQLGETSNSSCFVSSSSSASMLAGVLITVASAMIGGAYLVFWAIFSEQKDPVPLKGRMEFIDTHMTLGMIGLCNCIMGWPVLVGLHYFGLEEFQLPQSSGAWRLLVFNGLVEYAFDASCAVAIYMTSPVIVAVVGPLTIPLSMFVDNHFYGVTMVSEQHPWCTWIGAAAILGGTGLLQYKPNLKFDKPMDEKKEYYDNEALIPL